MPIGFHIVVALIVGLIFLAAARPIIGVVGNLLWWFFFGLQALSNIQRVEFDRRTRMMRQRNMLGLKWTEPLDRLAAVRVVRGRTLRGTPRIFVNLTRSEPLDKGSSPEYVVAVYFFPSEADEREAREWGDRLARFLHLPLRLELDST
jgi:hypothetical protein